MTDLIKRADAIDAMCSNCLDREICTHIIGTCDSAKAVAELPSADADAVCKAHEEEHLNIVNEIKELQYAIAKTQTIVGKMVESAEAVQRGERRMRFDWCKANLHTSCEEHKYDHCEMCNMARAYQHGYETAQEDMSIEALKAEPIRCKDCIHWKADNEVFELGFCCVFPQKWVAETFYCADGERREE